MFDRSEIDRLLNQITPGPWAWSKYGDQYEVWTQDDSVEPNSDVADNVQHLADAEFIAAAPALVAGLLDAVDQEHDRELRLAIRAAGCEKAETERDAANATLARIQAVAADVDQDGGHSGPSLARHILNIIGGGE